MTFVQSSPLGPLKVLAALRTAHTNGEAHAGVDVDGDSIADKTQEGVVDLMSTKESALRLAVDAAVTVLRVRVVLGLTLFFLLFVRAPRKFTAVRWVQRFLLSAVTPSSPHIDRLPLITATPFNTSSCIFSLWCSPCSARYWLYFFSQ